MSQPPGPGYGGQQGYGGPPQGGYGGQPHGGWQPPPPPQDGGSGGRSGPWPWIAGILVLLLLVGVGAIFVLGGDDDEQAAGEIFLEPAGATGPEPFSETPLGQPDSSLATPTTGEPSVAGTTTSTQASGGGTPGLYGGSTDSTRCDVEQMVAFLQGDQTKAQAFVDALAADPQLRAAVGTLTTANLPDYLRGLESFVLTADVRVTNHGFRDGRATRINSVLQRGHAVLVDQYGMVRVKCYCGNPIIAPQPVAGTPTYTGTSWQGFDPTQVTVIQPEPQPVGTFQIRDPQTGQLVPYVFGSGQQPAPSATSTPSPTATASQSPTATASSPPPSPSPTAAAPSPTSPVAPPAGANPVIGAQINSSGSYGISLIDHPPNAQVLVECEAELPDGTVVPEGSGTVTTDASGGAPAGGICQTSDPGADHFVTTSVNGSVVVSAGPF